MKEFDMLLTIAKRKTEFDKGNTWSKGAETYLSEIKKEVDEVLEEMPKLRQCYLEDELGDVLWDYLNALTSLEQKMGINTEAVLARACRKYEERVSGIESGEPWDNIKLRQNKALAVELKNSK